MTNKLNRAQLNYYRLKAHRKWFQSVPPRPAAKLIAVAVDRNAKARRPLGTC